MTRHRTHNNSSEQEFKGQRSGPTLRIRDVRCAMCDIRYALWYAMWVPVGNCNTIRPSVLSSACTCWNVLNLWFDLAPRHCQYAIAKLPVNPSIYGPDVSTCAKSLVLAEWWDHIRNMTYRTFPSGGGWKLGKLIHLFVKVMRVASATANCIGNYCSSRKNHVSLNSL